jgi:tRNA(fMet)-specific endonuclease VapC
VKYLLDTNAVISLLKRQPTLSRRLREHVPSDFGLPTVVAHELFYGAYKSQRQAENLAVVEALQFEVLDLDKEDAMQLGEKRAVLATAVRPIGPCDVLIAGQAKARGLTLITHNTSEFGRVDGLEIEDWEV